jgi:release factor glutamine methyltransferase
MTADGFPAAYRTGSAGFYRREFYVDERVLIPRPETEHIVEDALEFLHATGKLRILDAGTGSGAIACTIAAEIPGARVLATDVSPNALAVAAANAQRLGVSDRCRFVLADIAPPAAGPFDAIVANLPYIPTADVPRKPDPVGYEPRLATDGGADGMDQYRKLLAAAPSLLAPDGLLLMEGAPPTMRILEALAAAAFPGGAVTVHRDYARLERYVRVAAAR